MKGVSEFKGVFIHRGPVDMRKGISGLSEVVQMANMGDLMGPYLFVFSGRRKSLIKILYFDRSGFAMWQKRLEKDKFIWPKKFSDEVVQVTTEQLSWLLDGYDVWKMKPHEALSFERVI
jgi:transposase